MSQKNRRTTHVLRTCKKGSQRAAACNRLLAQNLTAVFGLALLLLVLGILADDHHMTPAANDLALFAHFFDRRSDFHFVILLCDHDFPRQVMRPRVKS